MKKFIQVLELLPKILAAVKMLEEFLPLPKTGKAKLDLILGIASDIGGEAKDLIPIVTNIIDKVVGMANKTGAFSTTSSTSTQASG